MVLFEVDLEKTYPIWAIFYLLMIQTILSILDGFGNTTIGIAVGTDVDIIANTSSTGTKNIIRTAFWHY